MTQLTRASHFFLLLFAILLSNIAYAATISVTTFTDELNSDGDCSLREAVKAANDNVAVDACAAGSAAVVDVISVGLIGTFQIPMGSLIITDRVEIVGFGRQVTRIDGNNQRQIFRVLMSNPSHNFTVRKLTLQHGRSSSTISGTGGGAAQLEQGHTFRFEEVNFVENGTYISGGGAINAGPLIGNASARLEIDRCHFFDNYGEVGGGAVFAFPATGGQVPATIAISDSLFDGNWSDASGGALRFYNVGTVSLIRNQFIDNQADGSGGAIAIGAASIASTPIIQIEKSSFVSNESGSSGAAAFSYVNVLMSNSTFAGNIAGDPEYGAAIRTFSGTTAAIQYSTFYENGAGSSTQNQVAGSGSSSAIFSCNGCSVSLRSSIVWSASATDLDCSFDFNSAYTSLGSNLDGSGTCATAASDQIVADPRLLPLGGYGVPQTAFVLQTMPPLPSSAAVDFGPANNCPGFFGGNVTIDQRGLPRPVDGSGNGTSKCDSGAIEYQPGVDLGEFTLSVILAGPGSGSVSSDNPGIDCPGECSSDFVESSVVQLGAVASPGSQFSGWSGDCSGMGSCTILMDQAHSVTANFIDSNDFIFVDGFEESASH